MARAKAVKMILDIMEDNGTLGGLPRAIEIYNYLACYGEVKVTAAMIRVYFNRGFATEEM